jgi:uncharacterized membrane protein
MMQRRAALFGLTVSTAAIVAAYGSAFLPAGATRISALLMIFGIATMAISIMALGSVRHGEKLGILAYVFAVVFIVLLAGFSLALLMPDADDAATQLFLGLPPRAAIVVYGIGILPVLVLPLAYAWTFEKRTLTEADLERVREAAKAHASKEASQ